MRSARRRAGAADGRPRSARQHLLDGLPGHPELARDVGLGEALADQLPDQVAALGGELPRLARVLEGVGPDLPQPVEGFLVLVSSARSCSHSDNPLLSLSTGSCHGYPGQVRLVSLLPSATEIVYALGLGDDLVGVTFECDEPPAARAEKTVVVGGRDTSGMTPAEIDGYVRDQLAGGEDLYTLHADALARLRPDLILTQDLCRVCALPSGHVSQALDYLGCRADVLSLDPYSLDEVLGTILAVGERTGTADRAARLVAGLRARLASVAARVGGPPASPGGGRRVGGPAVHGRALDPRPGDRGGRRAGRGPPGAALRPADLGGDRRRAAPTWSSSRRAATTWRARWRRPPWSTAALPGVPVWAIDADALVVRPGPRLVDGVEAIAAILHPGTVPDPPAGSIALVHSRG